MIERNILKELEAWKESKYRKPLLLRGARQVGKTTIVHEFGRGYENYLYFNLEDADSKSLLERQIPLTDKLPLLFTAKGKRKREGRTLLFIDEIQNSPETIALLRYFYEEYPDIHVITAGSLLENIVDVKVSFPVGRVQYMALHPCSFLEFARALGRENLLDVMQTPEYTTSFHRELMSLFNQYAILGGMPEVVQRYAEDRDLLAVDDVYETLIQAYRDDVEKYVRQNKLGHVVRFILEMGWKAAGETITLGNFLDSAYKSKEVGEAFRLLEKAMLLELSYPTASTEIPFLPQTRRAPKLFWLDTGLVNYVAGVRKEIISATDILDVWRGRIGEHLVAQELLTLNSKVTQRRGFWARDKKESSAEVDLVWAYQSHLFPIEVKTGNNASLRSLHSFMEESSGSVGIRVWSGPFSVDDVQTMTRKKQFRLISIPFYLVGHLERILDKYV